MKALGIAEKTLGEHPQVAASLNNLAKHFDAQGKLDRAEPLYNRALKITRKTLGAEHPDVAASLDHLGMLYAAQGSYDRAESHYRQALEIRRVKLGAVHALVAQSLEHYSLLLVEMGRPAEAQRAQTLAARIRARVAEVNRIRVENDAPRSKPAVKKIVTSG
jgi:tetratricopeptide (TPR) repeat protein